MCLVDAYFLNWNQFINAINSALRTLANIVIRCGEFCHHTSIKQSHFGHYLMQMIACLGMTKRKRESCMRRHFLSIVRKNEIVYYFLLFSPIFTHLFTALSQQKRTLVFWHRCVFWMMFAFGKWCWLRQWWRLRRVMRGFATFYGKHRIIAQRSGATSFWAKRKTLFHVLPDQNISLI